MLFALIILVAIIVLLGGGGIFLHALWIAAVVALILWLLGFLVRGASGGRWYRL